MFARKGTQIKSLALYTTIYPGVEAFLNDWYSSLREQTDQDFQLWIGLDAVGVEDAKAAMGGAPEAIWVQSLAGDTPAQIRQRALAQIVESCDGVILVDSDDVMHASRVASARSALQSSDLTGCALRLVDDQCRDIGMTMNLPSHYLVENVLPRNNLFGLSNSAFRTDLLQRCLPIPTSVALVDWFLATRAWLYGATLSFDSDVRMDYRQHSANMARVRPPFGLLQVVQDTESVRRHFQIMLTTPIEEALPDRLAILKHVAMDIEAFHRFVVLQPVRLESYVEALNAMEVLPLWWSCVAHPSLQHMWTLAKEKV